MEKYRISQIEQKAEAWKQRTKGIQEIITDHDFPRRVARMTTEEAEKGLDEKGHCKYQVT